MVTHDETDARMWLRELSAFWLGYWLDSRGNVVRYPAGERIFSSPKCPDPPPLGPTLLPVQWVTWSKSARAWSWPHTYSAEIKNAWNIPTLLTYTVMADTWTALPLPSWTDEFCKEVRMVARKWKGMQEVCWRNSEGESYEQRAQGRATRETQCGFCSTVSCVAAAACVCGFAVPSCGQNHPSTRRIGRLGKTVWSFGTLLATCMCLFLCPSYVTALDVSVTNPL